MKPLFTLVKKFLPKLEIVVRFVFFPYGAIFLSVSIGFKE